MARSRFGPDESQVQLCAVNRKRRQKDNSDLFRKVELRRRVCEEVKQANVFLAGSGFGQMFRHVWRDKARYTLALDTSEQKVGELRFQFPNIDARLADFSTFRDWPTRRRFQIADFDAFGNLYPGMAHFFETAPWRTPFYVIAGDSGPLPFKRTGYISQQLRGARFRDGYFGARDLDSYMERLVWPWWEHLAAMYNLDISCRACLANREKTIAYYSLKLDA